MLATCQRCSRYQLDPERTKIIGGVIAMAVSIVGGNTAFAKDMWKTNLHKRYPWLSPSSIFVRRIEGTLTYTLQVTTC
jgi:hypothetical protein